MLMNVPPARACKRYAPRPRAATSPPVAPLELIAATFDSGVSTVTLTFNQAIETGDIVLSLIFVSDVTYTGMTMLGASLIAQTANSVTVEMEYVAPASGSGVKLTVDAGNGIFPASGGDAWVGVNELALPFP